MSDSQQQSSFFGVRFDGHGSGSRGVFSGSLPSINTSASTYAICMSQLTCWSIRNDSCRTFSPSNTHKQSLSPMNAT
ncbi:Uncharacterized protein HZ326_19183 [Fusarium oxysporum f. sp. albedinis]|nr:Uncharacterized protein HZ326_19183 [Fusarium oxysporum f. sp. albedinis]